MQCPRLDPSLARENVVVSKIFDAVVYSCMYYMDHINRHKQAVITRYCATQSAAKLSQGKLVQYEEQEAALII